MANVIFDGKTFEIVGVELRNANDPTEYVRFLQSGEYGDYEAGDGIAIVDNIISIFVPDTAQEGNVLSLNSQKKTQWGSGVIDLTENTIDDIVNGLE